jgi:hypothetical protein
MYARHADVSECVGQLSDIMTAYGWEPLGPMAIVIESVRNHWLRAKHSGLAYSVVDNCFLPLRQTSTCYHLSLSRNAQLTRASLDSTARHSSSQGISCLYACARVLVCSCC